MDILRQEDKGVLVVSSGHTEDYRNGEYFSLIKKYIDSHNLHKEYYILGKIPYVDVNLLSQKCLAIINPSLFEGWSTTVEEAKTMGKKIILSNIAVHLEQNPLGGEFFNPNKPRELADKMWTIWNREDDYSFLGEDISKKNAERRRSFAEAYRAILINTIDRFKKKKG